MVAITGAGIALAAWKRADLRASAASAASQGEPMEVVQSALARAGEHQRTTTAVGTMRALRSIVLRNELAGTVHEVALVPGQIVEAGELLVALDVAVEQAELAAMEAQAALTETLLGRMQRAREKSGASDADVDRAKAERDVAQAQVARVRAVIERKTIRAPFRARVGLTDVHPGQYLDAGTDLTTLQGLDGEAHVDFTVSQDVAATLGPGVRVEVLTSLSTTPITANVVALDARIDPTTRNAYVRASVEAALAPPPGAAVRVRVPIGPPSPAVTVPVSALRKGPSGDHVFVVSADPEGRLRATERSVVSGAVLGDDVVIESGVSLGEQVATAGSFKLREGVLVVVADASTSR